MRPDCFASPEWFQAKALGLQIRYVFVPAELQSVLLSVVQAINATYRDEAATPASKRRSQGGMGADQLLPVRRTIPPACGLGCLRFPESSGMCTGRTILPAVWAACVSQKLLACAGLHDHFCLRSGYRLLSI